MGTQIESGDADIKFFNITVEYPPEHLQLTANFDEDKILLEGHGMDIEVYCEAEAVPQATYTWYKKHDDEDIIVAEGYLLSIEDVTTDHSGDYFCEAANVRGSVTIEKTITVYEEPDVHFEDDAECVEGESLTISCTSTGFPEPEVHIFKGDALIDGSEDEVDIVYQGNTAVLTFVHCIPEHAGEYECRAESHVGEVEFKDEESMDIDIFYAPKPREAHEEVEACPGRNVVLQCDFDANPQENIHWKVKIDHDDDDDKDGSGDIDDDGLYDMDNDDDDDEDDEFIDLDDYVTGNSHISVTYDPEHEGMITINSDDEDTLFQSFICVGSNFVGHSEIEYELVEAEAPEPIDEIHFSDIGPHSVKVTMSAVDDVEDDTVFEVTIIKAKDQSIEDYDDDEAEEEDEEEDDDVNDHDQDDEEEDEEEYDDEDEEEYEDEEEDEEEEDEEEYDEEHDDEEEYDNDGIPDHLDNDDDNDGVADDIDNDDDNDGIPDDVDNDDDNDFDNDGIPDAIDNDDDNDGVADDIDNDDDNDGIPDDIDDDEDVIEKMTVTLDEMEAVFDGLE